MGRETDLEQLERKEAETSAYRKERQVRLGHVPAPEEEEETEEMPEPEKSK